MIAESICQEALKLGYDRCGIINKEKMLGFMALLEKRTQAIPESQKFYAGYEQRALLEEYPWAKSIIICVRGSAHYQLPEKLKGLYGRLYLTDSRQDAESIDFQQRQRFNSKLEQLGIHYASDEKFGITALRYAAEQAGLGIVRKNNFFYTEKGSYLLLEAWLIDVDCEKTYENTVKQCPDTCHLCQKACKTASLCAEYTMNPFRCISYLTSFAGGKLPEDIAEEQLGTWVYGCDDCQTACPFNHRAETNEIDFPGLNNLANCLMPEKLAQLDDTTLLEKIQPKFWYVPKERIEQFRESARRVLRVQQKKQEKISPQ